VHPNEQSGREREREQERDRAQRPFLALMVLHEHVALLQPGVDQHEREAHEQDGEDAEEVVADRSRRRVPASVPPGRVVRAACDRHEAEQHEHGGAEQEGSSRRRGPEVPARAVVVLGHRRRRAHP
jgi:hypothetical protein